MGFFHQENKKTFPGHKYATRTGNVNYLMARHYLDFHNSHPFTLQVFGIDHIPVSIRKDDKANFTKRKLHKLQATKYPGLNEDLDFVYKHLLTFICVLLPK